MMCWKIHRKSPGGRNGFVVEHLLPSATILDSSGKKVTGTNKSPKQRIIKVSLMWRHLHQLEQLTQPIISPKSLNFGTVAQLCLPEFHLGSSSHCINGCTCVLVP